MNVKNFVLLLLFLSESYSLFASTNCEPAFPEAEGYGACSRGGKGGRILKVTTLKDDGTEGSFRWAVTQKGPRIVVFDVGGIITLNDIVHIENPYITIDGSTAPNGGVTFKDGTIRISTHDAIVRYIKVRPGDEAALKKGIWKHQNRKGKLPADAISISDSDNVIIDHVSTSWTSDEVLSVTNSRNITVQRSIITEPLSNPKLHVENGDEQEHAFGSLMSGENISYIKNVISNFKIRGPQMCRTNEKSGNFIIKLLTANNIIAFYQTSGTRIKLYNNLDVNNAVVNNLYINPLDKKAIAISLEYSTDPVVNKKSKIFISNNILPDNFKQNNDNWYGVYLKDIEKKDAEDIKVSNISFDYPEYLNLLPAEKIIEHILSTVGSSLPSRDPIDARVINQIKTGKGGGIIAGQDDVGGYGVNNSYSDSNDENQNISSNVIRCKSSKFELNNCDIPTDRAPSDIKLLKQYSNSKCIKGKSFGIKSHSVYVDNGCEGDFEIIFKSVNKTKIYCKSSNHKLNNCNIPDNDKTPSDIKLIKQYSNSECIKNKTFGIKSHNVFVDNGCEGDFEVIFASGNDIEENPENDPERDLDGDGANLRDVGSSVNQCLKRNIYATGLVWRSNKNFSGRNCADIGKPKTIYSLNYDRRNPDETYYCKNGNSKLTGIYFNPPQLNELHDLHLVLSQWDTVPGFSQTVCENLTSMFKELNEERPFLFHCSAGTDRTGMMAGFIVAILSEVKGIFSDDILNAIECDYEKSPDVRKKDDKTGKTKMGLLKSVLEEIRQKHRSVSTFFITKCSLPPELLQGAANKFIH